MAFLKFMFRFVRIRNLFAKVDAVGEQHHNAVTDLTNTLNGNGVKKKFKPRVCKQAVSSLRDHLGYEAPCE